MQTTDIVQSLGIVVALGIAAWQMRVQTRQAQASADLALMIKFDEINKMLLENPGLWKLLDDTYTPGRSGTNHEQVEYVVYMMFNTLELAHRHYIKYSLMRSDDWEGWQDTLDSYLRKPYVVGWWYSNGHEYSKPFAARVKARIVKLTSETRAT